MFKYIQTTEKVKAYVKGINLPLLLFLVLLLNVKLFVKLAAIVFIYCLRPDLNFGFKFKNSRLPLFYPLIISIGLIDWLAYRSFSLFNNNIAFLFGISFWVLCILAIHQIKLAVEQLPAAVLHKTITVFFLLNAVVSFGNILLIILKIHRVNPYMYQGNYQEYFLNTGDYIKGIFFDVSVTNSVTAAFGVIYFLVKSNIKMVFTCMAVLLLTASNSINIFLFGTLGLLFIFNTNRVQKSVIVVSLMMLVIFLAKVSPQNMYYVNKMYNKVVFHKNVSFDPLPVKEVSITDIPDKQLNIYQKQKKIAQLYLDSESIAIIKERRRLIALGRLSPAIFGEHIRFMLPQDSIHTATFQPRYSMDAEQLKLLHFIKANSKRLTLANDNKLYTIPGKIIAWEQTTSYLIHHPKKMITGDGIGNFSSKLAFKTTNLGIAGTYPVKLAIIQPEFLTNHLDIYFKYFTKSRGMHSILNSPNSVYDQLLAEYGIAGFAVFILFYLGFFLKQYRYLTYGLPLLFFMIGVFSIEYWFEQLSIIILLELLLFADLKDQQQLKLTTA